MPRRRPSLIRGLGLAFLIALAGVAGVVDARLKTWPDAGRVLSGGAVLASGDWPGFWSAVLRTHAGAGVAKALSREIGAVEREFRFATGIRPTPLRWSIWLGHRLVYSGGGGQHLLCLRPGLLLRACLALGLAPAGSAKAPLEFAWQDGYLLVFVGPRGTEAIAAAPVTSIREPEQPSLQFRLPGEPGDLTLAITAVEHLPVTISGPELASAVAASANPVPIPPACAGAVFDVLVGARGLDAVAAWQRIAARVLPGTLPTASPAAQTLKPLDEALPHGRMALERHVLFDVQFDLGQPILHEGRGYCLDGQAWGKHPYENGLHYPPLARIPYEWGETTGFLQPVLGADYTFGCATQGAWAHTANPPQHVEQMLIVPGAESAIPPELLLRLDWGRVAEIHAAWRRAQRADLGEDGAGKVFEEERTLSAWGDALRALGTLRVEMLADTDSATWRLRGELAGAAE